MENAQLLSLMRSFLNHQTITDYQALLRNFINPKATYQGKVYPLGYLHKHKKPLLTTTSHLAAKERCLLSPLSSKMTSTAILLSHNHMNFICRDLLWNDESAGVYISN